MATADDTPGIKPGAPRMPVRAVWCGAPRTCAEAWRAHVCTLWPASVVPCRAAGKSEAHGSTPAALQATPAAPAVVLGRSHLTLWPAPGSPCRLALGGRLQGQPGATGLVPARSHARRSAHASSCCLVWGSAHLRGSVARARLHVVARVGRALQGGGQVRSSWKHARRPASHARRSSRCTRAFSSHVVARARLALQTGPWGPTARPARRYRVGARQVSCQALRACQFVLFGLGSAHLRGSVVRARLHVVARTARPASALRAPGWSGRATVLVPARQQERHGQQLAGGLYIMLHCFYPPRFQALGA
jgi:hypothetical protein